MTNEWTKRYVLYENAVHSTVGVEGTIEFCAKLPHEVVLINLDVRVSDYDQSAAALLYLILHNFHEIRRKATLIESEVSIPISGGDIHPENIDRDVALIEF